MSLRTITATKDVDENPKIWHRVTLCPGKYLYLADTLSRPTSRNNKITELKDKFDEEVEAHPNASQCN
ncbi:hypothetical protein ILUMI_14972 [Ignelater luminosus]|uniref:Uncharacterized protein n=1 Tax=Ignelater luminosus TaxID=2038154 RepID=A0A8K0CT82_IGNLU|nr:hypothetical protein ILUMI_14972 [Ignelater luminosus]